MEAMAGRGRGRLAILPAWMTLDDKSEPQLGTSSCEKGPNRHEPISDIKSSKNVNQERFSKEYCAQRKNRQYISETNHLKSQGDPKQDNRKRRRPRSESREVYRSDFNAKSPHCYTNIQSIRQNPRNTRDGSGVHATVEKDEFDRDVGHRARRSLSCEKIAQDASKSNHPPQVEASRDVEGQRGKKNDKAREEQEPQEEEEDQQQQQQQEEEEEEEEEGEVSSVMEQVVREAAVESESPAASTRRPSSGGGVEQELVDHSIPTARANTVKVKIQFAPRRKYMRTDLIAGPAQGMATNPFDNCDDNGHGHDRERNDGAESASASALRVRMKKSFTDTMEEIAAEKPQASSRPPTSSDFAKWASAHEALVSEDWARKQQPPQRQRSQQQQQQRRETPMVVSLETNVGNELLKTMGWRGSGTGLGRSGEGITEAPHAMRVQGRGGVGARPLVPAGDMGRTASAHSRVKSRWDKSFSKRRGEGEG